MLCFVGVQVVHTPGWQLAHLGGGAVGMEKLWVASALIVMEASRVGVAPVSISIQGY